ncbi:esterase/lipase family protein [Pseudonocardia sp. CA-142604]|uniref:esterase/lipase family protein n=1 Tax=Pseudonocardia sp. CA-142604 TaxID=3240024 RepID=UPI003D92D1FE
MASTDLVVVLPGIMGSTLKDENGHLVWAPSAGAALRAIRTLGRNLKALQLPSGIGDGHPRDGVEPVALMPDLHAIPGIWTPLTGYDALVRRLEKLATAGKIGNVLPVAYDWRLSNRYNADRLATIVEPALQQWRESSPQRAEAQLVFVCHSMGGLVARWYVEKRGGAGHTRKIITLGTPYRGAAKAVEQLVNGVRRGIGPLSVDLHEFARSLPSLHQLLPDYACIDHSGALHRLDEIAVPELDTAMRDDALAFHAELAAAERARPASLAMTHAIVGIEQPTWTSLKVDGARVEPLDTIASDDDRGDGTVPLTGALGHELPMDTNVIHRIVEQHGHLQAHRGALDAVAAVLGAMPERRRGDDNVALRVSAPDYLLAGEPLQVRVDIERQQQHGLRIEVLPERPPGAQQTAVAVRTPPVRDGHIETAFADLGPGAYEVRVTGVAPGSPVTAVTATTLVWTHDE